MPEAAREPKTDAPRRRLLRRGPASAPAAAPGPVAQAVRSAGRGEPLHPAVSMPLAHRLGVELEPVRVHTGATATAAARSMSARAFTYGTDVFLADGEQPTDLALMAHEVAHVVQQQGVPTPQAFAPTGAGLEREAERTASAVSHGEPAAVEGRTGGPRVQGLLGFIGDWLEDKVMDALERWAPVLVPIVRKGFFGWLKEKITDAFEAIVDIVMAPVRAVTGIIESVSTHFTNLVRWVREAAEKIAQGDCSSITEAAQKIQDVVTALAAPVIERVQAWIDKAKEFLSGIWERFGKPVVEFFKRVGGKLWETIKDIATWIWDKTEPIRDWLARAWRWIKRKLGIGEGTDGKNGILSWVEDKLAAAWDWLKEKVEPYKKAILIVVGVVGAVTLGPFLAIGAVGAGLFFGIRWIAQHMKTKGSVVDQRGVLEREVIPKIMGAVKAVGEKLRAGARFLVEKFGSVIGGLAKAAGQLATSIIGFLVRAISWLIDKFKLLLQWAVEKVQAVAEWIGAALERLRKFLEPILEIVRWLSRVIADILNLVSGVIKKIWNKIPACIREPIKNFLINQILKRIPIFSKLLEVKDIWDKVKTAALEVITAIFVKWDLKAAVLRFFELILAILEIPLDLVKSIYTKARTAFTEILKDPLGFLRNTLRAAWEGFGLFFENIATHLWNGVINWFKGQMKKAGIEIPSEFSFKGILAMIFSIAGLSVEKIFEILEKRLKNKPLVAKIRKFYKFLTGVWEWVSVALDKGAIGLWEKIKQTAGELWDALLTALVGWVSKQVIKLASPRLLAALNPIGAIINAILAAWAAIQTVAEYARQVLEIVNTVLDTALDLARGVTGRAAGFVEKALAAAIPMAVGFLANFVRLGNLGERVKEMLEPIQKKVEDAIGAIIDVAISAGRAILEKLGIGGPPRDEVTFEAAGETHSMWVEGEDDTAKLMVASAETKEYEDHLNAMAGDRIEKEIARKEDQKAARKALDRGREKLREWKKARGPARLPLRDEAKEIMKELFGWLGHPTVPAAVWGFDAGTSAWVRPLTRRAGDTAGDESTTTFLHDDKRAALNLVLPIWRALHLVSARLHGPNKPENFILGTQQANSLMLSKAEDLTVTDLAGNEGKSVLWYETTYTTWPAPDEYAAQELVITRGKWDAVKKELIPADSKTPVTIPSARPSLEIGAIDIHQHGRVVLEKVAFAGAPGAEGAAISIVKLRDEKGPFRNEDELFNAVDSAPPGTLRAGRETIRSLVQQAVAADRLKFG